MRIIHFSDIHAGGPAEDWLAYIDKRWVGVFNYRFRRKFQHDLSKLEKAVDYILAARPDVAVCTGDLTSTGQPGEFAKVKAILSRLHDAAIPLLFVPGNHDYYVHRPRCVTAMKSMVEYLTDGAYSFAQLPLQLRRQELDFIVINESRPSNLLSSHGVLKPETSRFVEAICNNPKDVPRVLIGHYPLLEDHPFRRCRHRLYGQKRVAELLRTGAIDLALCGHVHKPYARLDDTGRGESCAGSVTRNGSMSLIEYLKTENRFHHQRIEL